MHGTASTVLVHRLLAKIVGRAKGICENQRDLPALSSAKKLREQGLSWHQTVRSVVATIKPIPDKKKRLY